MNMLFFDSIELQMLMVSALTTLTALGVTILGLGLVVATTAPTFGHRMKRLGLQIVGACLAVIMSHAVLIEVYNQDIPPALIMGLYAVVGLLLLQGLLNLLFGPKVGNGVVASLLTALITSLILIAFRPLRSIVSYLLGGL